MVVENAIVFCLIFTFEAFVEISEDCGIEYVLKILDMTIYKHVEDVNYDDITDFKTKLQN